MRMVLVCLLLCGWQTLFAQKKQLLIGNKVPYEGKIQQKTGSIILSELKGPLIIDLFSSNCIVCFQMMPKVNKLQQQFKGSLRILLLGYLDTRIEKIYQKFQQRLQLQLEVAFDSLFYKQVEVGPLPSYVWVGRDGRIAAITGPEEITATNVELFIADKELPFAVPPGKIYYDYYKPYLLYGNGGPDSNFFVRSVLGPWNPAQSYILPPARMFNDSGRVFNVVGVGMENLFNYAYWGVVGWSSDDSLYGKIWSHPVLETGLPAPTERYCYSVAYNGRRVPDLATIMQKDLESFFGVEAHTETREMPCYVLRLREPGLLRSKAGNRKFEMTHAGLTMKLRQIRHLLQALFYYDTTDIPFVDETGIDYPIDLSVDAILTDQADFFAALRKAGIIIEKRSRPMEVLVLRSKKDVAAYK